MEKEKTTFQEEIQLGRQNLEELDKRYRKTIDLMADLKNKSRQYMDQLSQVEGGLTEIQQDEGNQINRQANHIFELIDQFNEQVRNGQVDFSDKLAASLDHFARAVNKYSAAKGEFSDLLKVRRSVMYVDVLLRKMKNNIIGLQLMNNILFTFSSKLKEIQEEYRQNLIAVNAELNHSTRKCDKLIKKIEFVN
jgi:hypothetical protein